jgi:hypothetical protein
MVFNLSSSSLNTSSLFASSFAMRLDEESLSLIDVPTFLRSRRQSRKTVNDHGKKTPHSTDVSSFSSSMSSCSDFNFEAEERGQEQEQECNTPEDPPSLPKAYFIPGITGRARCLEGSSTSTDVVTQPPRRRVASSRRSASRGPRQSHNGSMARGSTCSGSSSGSIMSGLSQDTNYDSISDHLAEARELLSRYDHSPSSGTNDVDAIESILANLDAAARMLRSAHSVSSLEL